MPTGGISYLLHSVCLAGGISDLHVHVLRYTVLVDYQTYNISSWWLITQPGFYMADTVCIVLMVP